MCGGRGTRLETEAEKPLFPVAGRPMVDRVLDALAASRIDSVTAAVTPATPETAAHLDARGLDTVETPGAGYVSDLDVALDAVETPALTVAADLPLLDGAAVNRVLAHAAAGSVTDAVQVCVPAELKRQLGASADTTYERDGREVAPAGVNVVADTDTETMFLSYDVRYAVNVNHLDDAVLAEALL
ncbi:NTP transferase domain-containing protein (plasmid) [Halarchaeum sp. CBA1220]|nr:MULTISPECIES: NTP transferase domain-containing protein [Halarchaeum]QLC35269.1 NTP transferase domain-containing protein [Halarchaeum sp. CBA1220]